MEKTKAGAGTPADSLEKSYAEDSTTCKEKIQHPHCKLLAGNYLKVHVGLAQLIGVEEAMVLNQLDCWLRWKVRRYGLPKDGVQTVYNTYRQWQVKSFPFWTESKIRRIIGKLETRKLIAVSGPQNQKLYMIDYERLDTLYLESLTIYKNDSCLYKSDRHRVGAK